MTARSERRFAAGIFDLGGVLVDWDPRHLYRKLFAGDVEGMERFLAEVTTPQWNLQMDAGRAFQGAIDELKADHPDKTQLIQAYYDRWPEMLGRVDDGVAQIIRDVRKAGLRVFALSNWSAETFAIGRPLIPELELFDDILISGEARRTKPDKALFQLACARFGVLPAKTFFVDDAAANVQGARSIGLKAIQFTNAAALRSALEALAVLGGR